MLDTAAFWADDGVALQRTLEAGLASPEHAASAPACSTTHNTLAGPAADQRTPMLS